MEDRFFDFVETYVFPVLAIAVAASGIALALLPDAIRASLGL